MTSPTKPDTLRDTMQALETDYLVIGAGATGLAFADTLLQQSDAHITFVDQHAQPGGGLPRDRCAALARPGRRTC